MSSIFEFYPEKNFMIEYKIKRKTYDQFKEKFETNKWLNLIQWYEISTKIDNETLKRAPNNGRFKVGSLDVFYDFLKIEECPMKLDETFQKNLQYLRVTVECKQKKKKEKPIISVKEEYDPAEPAKPDENSQSKPSTSTLEYVPKEISSTESENSKTYVPSKKQNDYVEEYSPVDLNNGNSQPLISYTPSRIKSLVDEDDVENSDEEQENKRTLRRHHKITKSDEIKKTLLNKELFGDNSDDDEQRPKTEIISIASSSQTDEDYRSSKRQKLDRESKKGTYELFKYNDAGKDRGKERDKNRKESSRSKDRKRKNKDKDKHSTSKSHTNSPTLSKWITTDKALTSNSSNDSTKPSAVKNSSSSSTFSLHNHKNNKNPEKSKMNELKEVSEMMDQYHDLKNRMEVYHKNLAERKDKLKDMKILSCEGYSNEKITETIVHFSDMIEAMINAYRQV